MRKNPRVGVVLTQEARDILQKDSIQLFLVQGNHFNCESAEQVGSFLRMRIQHDDKSKGTSEVFEVEIPLHFVLYTVSAEAKGALGFK